MARRTFLETAQASLPQGPVPHELVPISGVPVSPASEAQGSPSYNDDGDLTQEGQDRLRRLLGDPEEARPATPGVDPDHRGNDLDALKEPTVELPIVGRSPGSATTEDPTARPRSHRATDDDGLVKRFFRSPITFVAAAGNTQAYKLAKVLKEKAAASLAENPNQRRVLSAGLKLGSLAVLYGGVSAAMRVLPGLRYTPAAELFDMVGILDNGPDALPGAKAQAKASQGDGENMRWVAGEKPQASSQPETGTNRIPMAASETGGQKTGSAPDTTVGGGKKDTPTSPAAPDQPATPKTPPAATPEFSKAAQTVEGGEGWFKELGQIGITDADDRAAFLKEHGKELEARGLAYWDPDQKQWGMNLGEGTISQEDLTWIHNTAVHEGFIEGAPASAAAAEQPAPAGRASSNVPGQEEVLQQESDTAGQPETVTDTDGATETKPDDAAPTTATPQRTEQDKDGGWFDITPKGALAATAIGTTVGFGVPVAVVGIPHTREQIARSAEDQMRRREEESERYLDEKDESKIFVTRHGRRGKRRGESTAPPKVLLGQPGSHRDKRPRRSSVEPSASSSANG